MFVTEDGRMVTYLLLAYKFVNVFHFPCLPLVELEFWSVSASPFLTKILL